MVARTRYSGLLRCIALVLAASVLGGCGGGGGVNFADFPCSKAQFALPGTLTSPANGATGVATTIASLTFTVPQQPAAFAGGSVLLSSPTSQSITGPIAVSGSVYSAALPGLAPQTTYQVSATSPQITDCGGRLNSALGSFTTQ